MIKIKEIELRVRRKLLDTYEDNYRFAPAEVFDALRDAVTAIRGDRPESRYVSGLLVGKGELLVLTPADPAPKMEFVVPEAFPAVIGGSTRTLTDYRAFSINIEEEYTEALVYHMLHALYLKDDTDTGNAERAKMYFEKYALTAKA